MGLMDWLVLAAIAAVLGLAGRYVWRARKKGSACIGCPHSAVCGACRNCSGGCGKP